jgi:hypothetical protein
MPKNQNQSYIQSHTTWQNLPQPNETMIYTMRTASSDESPFPLVTIPRMDNETLHNPYQSHKLAVLESPT